MALFGRTSRYERFWRWFERADLRVVEGELFVPRVSKRLKEIHDCLTCEVGPPNQHPRELVLSSDGIREGVEHVEALADAAPSLPGWTITRFRGRTPGYAGVTRKVDGRKFGADDMRVLFVPEGTLLHCVLFTRWCAHRDGTPDLPSMLMLDCALGEYDVMMSIGAIEMYPLDQAPEHALPWDRARIAFDEARS